MQLVYSTTPADRATCLKVVASIERVLHICVSAYAGNITKKLNHKLQLLFSHFQNHQAILDPGELSVLLKSSTWNVQIVYLHPPVHTSKPDIGMMVRVFTNGSGDLGSIPGSGIPKTQKMVLDASLLNTQQYKVQIKGKVEQSRERSSALPYTLV